MRARSPGFTLIELMITVAIVAILAAIAYPSYRDFVIRGKRTAAQSEMMDIANRQQQFLLVNRAYADASKLVASGYSLSSEVSENYDFSINLGDGPPPSFTIVFTPKGAQVEDGELTLSSDGNKTPQDKW